jgi:hypothetical protein
MSTPRPIEFLAASGKMSLDHFGSDCGESLRAREVGGGAMPPFPFS